MKKGILLAVYVVLAAAIIAWGAWYANTLTSPTASTVQTDQSGQNSVTAEATTSTNNQNMDTLKIVDTTVGTGAEAKNGDMVTVNYTGTLDDGTKFDSSLNPGRTPFSFTLGRGQVIQGWDQGVLGMKVGGTRELTIPASLGYGASGQGPIPPNATLHFTVTLLSVSLTQQ